MIKVNLKEREKKALIIAGGAILLAILYQWGLVPVLSSQEHIREKLAAKEIILAKSAAKIAQKVRLTAKTKAIKEETSRAEKKLLHGKTPSLAAAELQKILKKIANKHKVRVRSEKILSPIEIGEYRQIPVRITFKGLLTNLKSVFYKIESNPLIIVISDTTIKVVNTRNPSNVEATLTVAGIIKTAEAKKTEPTDKKTKTKSKKTKGKS